MSLDNAPVNSDLEYNCCLLFTTNDHLRCTEKNALKFLYTTQSFLFYYVRNT